MIFQTKIKSAEKNWFRINVQYFSVEMLVLKVLYVDREKAHVTKYYFQHSKFWCMDKFSFS